MARVSLDRVARIARAVEELRRVIVAAKAMLMIKIARLFLFLLI